MKNILLVFIAIGLISCSDTKKDKYVEQAEKELIAIKAWAEKKTVKEDNSEIQKLKIGDKAHGGVVAHIDSTGKHGIVCSLEVLPAEKRIEDWSPFNGYSDWRLPTSKEQEFYLCANLHKKGFGSFEVDEAYLSSSRIQYGDAFCTAVWSFNLECNGGGQLTPLEGGRKIYIRAVRDF